MYNPTYNGGGYFTKNDYQVDITHDFRSGKDKVTSSSTTLYGSNHATEIGVLEYAKIKITGNDGDVLPGPLQFMVFGSGKSDPGWGEQADPNNPVMTIDFAAFQEINELIGAGMQVPDLKGADPAKIPEILSNYQDVILGKKNPVDKKESSKYKKGKVVTCSACGVNFEMKDSKGNGTVTNKKSTDTTNLENH